MIDEPDVAGARSGGLFGPAAIRDRAEATGAWLAARDYRGWDPYDGLESPLASVPPVATSRTLRFALQQAVKRSPVNLRPLLRIAPGRNPVTLALAAQGHAYLAQADSLRAEPHADVARALVRELAELGSTGWSGSCWGYDFPWQARRVWIPARAPTVVATGIVTNALYEVGRVLGDSVAHELMFDAIPFVTEDLHRTNDADGGLCFSYSPFDRQIVLNASMKAARLCAQVATLTGAQELLELATRAVAFVSSRQRRDGSWPYSEGDERSWSDNFHTGYVLECMLACDAAGVAVPGGVLDRGFSFYVESFFGAEGEPLYYPGQPRPVDATACAQSLLTLCAFREPARALAVARWVIDRLGNADGGFGYRVGSVRVQRTAFPRWSVAWMFCALSRLAVATC